jgi:hypothetical protein
MMPTLTTEEMEPMTNSIIRTEHGAFCAACQSLLSIEEEDFGVCDACDGEGIGGDAEDDDYELLNPPMENSGETGNARAASAMTGPLPVAGAPTNLPSNR